MTILALTITLCSALAAADEGCNVSGRVTDAATGAGIAGAEVWLHPTEHAVLTEEDGRFALAAIPLDRHRPLWVTAAGYCGSNGQNWVIPTPGGAIEGIEIALRAVPLLRVSVTCDGAPVVGAAVMLGDDRPGVEVDVELSPRTPVRVRTTDAAGVVSFDRVDASTAMDLFAVVTSPEHETRRKEIRWDGRGPKELDVVLERAPERVFLVRGADGPLEEGLLILCDRVRNWRLDERGVPLPTPYEPDLRTIAIGEGGRAVFRAREWPEFAAVISPRIGIRLLDVGKVEGARERSIAVSPGPRWEGRFVDGDGRPLEGVLVTIQDRLSGDFRTGHPAPDSTVGPLFSALTDAEGRISLPRLEEASGWQRCAVDVRKAGWRLEEPRGAFLEAAARTIVLVPEEPLRRVPIRLVIDGAETPRSLAIRTLKFSGDSPEESRRLQKLRATLREDEDEPRERVSRYEPRLREHDTFGNSPTFHVSGLGRWPLFAAETLLRSGDWKSADLLLGPGGSRALVDRLLPELLFEPGAALPEEPIEVRLLPPGG